MAIVAILALVAILSGGNEKKPAPVVQKPKPKPPPKAVVVPPRASNGSDWPLYGNTPQRTRYVRAANLRPPFRKVWTVHGGGLIEFQPVIAAGRLFALRNDGRAFAIGTETGRFRWRKRVGSLAASAPAVGGASVYFVVNAGGYGGIAGAGRAKLVAVRRRSGTVRFSKRLGSSSESSPLLIGERVYMGSQNGTVYCMSARDGHVIWTYHAGAPVKSALAWWHGKLYFGDYGGSITALRAKNGSLVWRSGVGGEVYATPAVAFGRVYVGSKSGAVSALNANNGRRLWSRGTGAYVYAAPAVAAVPGMPPAVFVGSYSGRFYAFRARDGAVLWSRPAGGIVSGAASVIGQVVYFSALTARRTYAVSAKTGRLLWTLHAGAFNPAISDGKRIYITGYGSEYAFTTPRRLRREKIAFAKRARALKLQAQPKHP